jgi:inosine-uridine nucleoside N-ribohydrolase
VDLSGGISLGKTVGDFYNYGRKPANLKVALGVKARDFMELFLERLEKLARIVPTPPESTSFSASAG